MELDLSQPEAPNVLLDEVNEKLGLPSILVNNATHSIGLRDKSFIQMEASGDLTIVAARVQKSKLPSQLLIGSFAVFMNSIVRSI